MKPTKLTTAAGCPVVDNQNVMTAGPRGPQLLQDVWFLEKLAHFDREVIPERRMHAKGSGAYGTFTVTHDITRFTRAKLFSEIGKKTEMFVRSGCAGQNALAWLTPHSTGAPRCLADFLGSGAASSSPCETIIRPREYLQARINALLGIQSRG